jgi:hypothetical protein
LCDRWHKLPSEIEAESGRLMWLLNIEEAAGLGGGEQQ